MPLIAPAIKNKFKLRIYNSLKREFASSSAKAKEYPMASDEQWLKMANAISDIAFDIVEEIQTNAMVVPGQVVAGAPPVPGVPISGATTSPGNIK